LASHNFVLISPAVVSKHNIIKPGGSLTLTSGWNAPRPKKGAALSDALNNGVKSLTESLSDELSDKRIRVNTVAPGWVRTAFWDRAGQSKEEQDAMFEGMAKKLYVGFIATPEDIAESYLYLVRADYANGSIVAIGT
jgi:NAD(P)-dependent dehydrogenase (short-subunit alcohol dehydrogenase family)